MKKLLIMGPPGAGKGTQAVNFSNNFGICHISTGEMFRRAMRMETKMGILAKQYVDHGELVPDDITVGIVKERLAESDILEHGFLLDGFPRNLEQAKALDKILKELDYKLDAVINIDVNDEEVIKRIIARRICTKCGATFNLEFNPPKKENICDVCGATLIVRKDDNHQTASTRISIYKEQTQPLLAYYKQQGLVVEVDGNQKVDKVFLDIVAKLGN